MTTLTALNFINAIRSLNPDKSVLYFFDLRVSAILHFWHRPNPLYKHLTYWHVALQLLTLPVNLMFPEQSSSSYSTVLWVAPCLNKGLFTCSLVGSNIASSSPVITNLHREQVKLFSISLLSEYYRVRNKWIYFNLDIKGSIFCKIICTVDFMTFTSNMKKKIIFGYLIVLVNAHQKRSFC